ncbi:M23 family metallopeptidase [Agromyces atrinae]|uniref:M23 family metallopeptidase n=1 Tax=Agromyces atrinae TaxID=592376 RepID=A0A4Q2M752_9MICO|nr:M23 family metallopeptidase [Agromyces atrinae]RXZ85741.1 M23 family metallopeptidase [Agromyces atrinae]
MTSPSPRGRRAAPRTPLRSRRRTNTRSAAPRRATVKPAASAPAQRRPGTRRRSVLSMLAMSFTVAIALATGLPSTVLPAMDVAGAASIYETVAPSSDIRLAPQSFASDATAELNVTRESYSAEAAPPPIISEVASMGSVELIETELVVWPIPSNSRVSSGFGPRAAPCDGCSTMHDGIDFNPGNGSPIVSIADGVVVLATENGGGLGVNVEVQHNIGGRLVTSSYGHMQYGSLAVSRGDIVTAGQLIGLVGSTGQSTGPHLHLEMFYEDGVRFDGLAWLQSYAG